MWIVLRLAVMALVFAARYVRKPATSKQPYGDTYWATKLLSSNKQTHTIGMPHATPLRFHFTRERGWDRFAKAVGLSYEVQTGDAAFDQRVYVACDHPWFERALRSDAELRGKILELFACGAKHISADGEHVWVELPKGSDMLVRELEALHALIAALSAVESPRFGAVSDAFFWKALIVESGVWSLSFYGLPAFVQLMLDDNRHHFAFGRTVVLTAVVFALAFALIFMIVFLVLRGSSRGHRVLIETFALLMFALPATACMFVLDANDRLDTSPAQVIAPMLTDKHTTRCGKNNRSTCYWLDLRWPDDVPPAVRAHPTLQTRAADYFRAQPGAPLEVTLRRGRLRIPWIERVTIP